MEAESLRSGGMVRRPETDLGRRKHSESNTVAEIEKVLVERCKLERARGLV